MTFILSFLLQVAHALPFTAPRGAAEPPPATDLRALATCEDSLDLSIFNTPRRPYARAPMRVLVTSETDLGPNARIVVRPPKSDADEILTAETFGGPPWGWVATVEQPVKGDWRVGVAVNGRIVACQAVEVRGGPSGPGELEVGSDPWWETRIKWERDTENLYSLWIERLFLAPLGEDISWKPLALALKDPSRNLLYGYMGLDEDKDGLRANPDCADFPYTLRAYFAWKLGLPMALRGCRRGNAARAPTCGTELHTSEEPTTEGNRVQAFKAFMRKLQATIHSSSLRGAPGDEKSDLYPVKLNRHGLRPGAIYADPYGHTMMVGRWFPQTETEPGVLMAIDAQPDGTVGRRVFWRGAFLFPKDDAVAGAGWKRFRPVRRGEGGLVELDNDAIAASIDYGDYSVEQWSFGQEGFYEKMDEVINPMPMTPELALKGLIDALEQQTLRRLESIDSVEDWKRKLPNKVIPMPPGVEIFLTAGPWEDFSTPARDMRLLIAIDTVQQFPARVAKYPKRFVLTAGEAPAALQTRLAKQVQDELARRAFSYKRSDGTPWKLTLASLFERTAAFEISWNPNDCPEFRWGAAEGSDEMTPCARRAPADQQTRMETARAWFHKRERPLQH